jgi:hypothetical protein
VTTNPADQPQDDALSMLIPTKTGGISGKSRQSESTGKAHRSDDQKRFQNSVAETI